jgi:transcriptional regulator with XRE-family HTH domain
MSCSAVIMENGLSSGNLKNWKNGRIPKPDILQKLASYFNVSVDYLLGEEKKTTENDGLSDAERELLELFNLVPADKQKMVLQMIRVALSNQ